MSQAKDSSFCADSGHKFIAVDNAVERRDLGGGKTEIHHAFICQQCGNVIQRKVATWHKASKRDDGKEPF